MKNAWEKAYRENDFELWMQPHTEMESVAMLFCRYRIRRVLDLGCGAGRHTVFLAKMGFDVYGLDSSPSGLAYTFRLLDERRLSAHLTLHDMSSLPYDNCYFDAIISVQTIHHNTVTGVRNTIKEIARVLKEKGLIWLTIPVSKNEPSKKQKEIEPRTFVPLDGREKGLPHHYFKADEVCSLLSEFQLIDLHIDTVNHFSILAQKI